MAGALVGILAVPTRVTAAVSGLTLAALAGGIFMSINYWLATAWMAPADDAVNALMAVIQVTLAMPLALALAAGHGKMPVRRPIPAPA